MTGDVNRQSIILFRSGRHDNRSLRDNNKSAAAASMGNRSLSQVTVWEQTNWRKWAAQMGPANNRI